MEARDRSGAVANDHWATPPELYKELDDEFHFDFYPCPLHAAFDGLVVPWGMRNYVNPPYNKFDKPKFILRAYREWVERGATSVLLLPIATSTAVFHDVLYPYCEIRFLRGRVKFIGEAKSGSHTGKHDSMVCVFHGKHRS